MSKVLVVLAVIVAASFAGSFRLSEPVVCGGTDDLLQYDDGSAHWLTWGGTYRGTWFDVTDFLPGAYGFEATYMEYWFYHHSTHPWDTSDFYAELWNGDASGPVDNLDQQTLTATHYASIHANFSPVIETDGDFWGLVNTEMSSGGWPALLGDNTPNSYGTDHSFFSDDFIIWEPWIITGSIASDYFVRASGDILAALDSESWGAIKGLYR